MRPLLILLALCFALPALAEDAQPAKPKDLEPLPESAAPPEIAGSGLEPQVTIVQRGQEKVEEYRINGRLYMIKVTPPHGVPYYLVDYRGDGRFSRQDHLDSGVRVPMWVIFSF